MDAEQFIKRWSRSKLKERSAAQTHFNDLCSLLGIKPPIDSDPSGDWYGFEIKTRKRGNKLGFADVARKGVFAWEYKGDRKDLDEALDKLRQYAPALNYPKLLVVSDTKVIRVVTAFNGVAEAIYQYELPDLRNPSKIEQLRFIFEDPERLKPGVTQAHVTAAAAENFRVIVDSLRLEGHEPRVAAHFATQLLFCLFAEDIGILKERDFREILKASESDRDQLVPALTELFAKMDKGGLFGAHRIPYFNGRLFAVHEALPLSEAAFAALSEASKLTWSDIHPAIFGTLFERGMNPGKADQVGRHYTDPAKIRQIIDPVILDPLIQEWGETRAKIQSRIKRGQRAAAQNLYERFIDKLSHLRILDPACGSGNFLYLALQGLKNLEHQVGLDAEQDGLERGFPQIDPSAVFGIDTDEYAVELARVTIWIGQIQWMKLNGYGPPKQPILPPLDNIEHRDALLNPNGGEALWPKADFIVGNPPFLGGSKLLRTLGEQTTNRIRAAFRGRVPGGADLVAYWFDKARVEVADGRCMRVGLVATNSIRGGLNRKVLERIRTDAEIFHAWGDEEWTVDGADVRVSLVAFGRKDDPWAKHRWLNGRLVPEILPDLSGGRIAFDPTAVKRLVENSGIAFGGTKKDGPFEIPGSLARMWLQLPANPNGRSNSDVLRPWANGIDVTRRPTDRWIIDFGIERSESVAALYEKPFEYVVEHVKPERLTNRDRSRRTYWWLHGRTGEEFRKALAPLDRYIATPTVSKHRLFVWMPSACLADHALTVVAKDDDTTFGILHSRFHELWSLRMCTWLGVGNDPRYTPTTTFETFPFPDGLTPDKPATAYLIDPRAKRIAATARKLVVKRDRWLNPREWVDEIPEVATGFQTRKIPRPAHESDLRLRTLTNLYNEMPQWLRDAHSDLDDAVAAAYDWRPDLPDSEILKRLLELNLERAKEQA